MADQPDSTISRPPPIPLPSRIVPTPKGVTSLLNRGTGSTPIPPSLQAKMAAMANRSALSVDSATNSLQKTTLNDFRLPPSFSPTQGMRPPPSRRPKPGLKLSDMGNPLTSIGGGTTGAGLGASRPSFSIDTSLPKRPAHNFGTPFSNFGKIVDPSGALSFSGKAVLHASGVDFSSGSSYTINMEQLQLFEDLGKGTYGVVKRVLHKPTNVAMAMKEIRLELDQAKLNAIIMELDILHRAVAPEIVEFYGAFFIESCVYYCMELMDAGSLDKLQGAGVPEDVLARITASVVRGLRFLKDEMQIIHRDVKPTNVLVNTQGQIKLCDFGVSGQLEKSLAKTNIGCQSYMAPERIKGESQNNVGTYTVSSDVWSVGLTVIEVAMGHYPYPPETYANVFAQLTAIVHGDPPELPDKFSDVARDFTSRCLQKIPQNRATYSELLEHQWLVEDAARIVDMAGWVAKAMEWKRRQRSPKPEGTTNGS